MSDSTEFFDQIKDLRIMKAFSAVLPLLCREQGPSGSIGFVFESTGEGVGAGITLPERLSPQAMNDISLETVRRLKVAERLFELEMLIGEFNRVGVAAEEIDRLREEGERLVKTLHNPDHEPGL